MRAVDPGLLRHLSERSAHYRDPLAHIDWDALDTGSYWLPETALSLYGLPAYATLTTAVRLRLSQYEFINVICCGLWLESVFLQRLARELRPGMARSEYEYLLHQVREESGHSLMFLRAITASGLPLPEDAWRCPRFTGALARWAPARGDVFRLAMVIGEHVPDAYNRWLRRQAGDGLNPVVAAMCTLHVVDEARHIAVARNSLERALDKRSALRRAVLGVSARLMLAQLVDVFYFPPARFYELAGLVDGARWRRRALASVARRRFVEERLRSTLDLLESYGLPAAR